MILVDRYLHLFATLPPLFICQLQDNNLQGHLPSCIFNLCLSYNLTTLNLQDNYFSGPFPSIITSFPGTVTANLSCNNFTGPFPQSCANTTCSICEGKEMCGNDVVENGEQCDPPGQCCSDTCTFLNYTSCQSSQSCNGSFCVSGSCVCGNCGDGYCEDYENCVSCSIDCRAPCGLCGDGYCEADETCHNCSADCGWCPGSTSCGKDCSQSGTCVDGVCLCWGSYTGIFCESVAQPFRASPSNYFPLVNISTPLSSEVFQAAVQSLYEIDPNGNIIQRIDLTTVQFKMSSIDNSTYQSWQYTSSTFWGSCQVIATIYLFNATSTVAFGNMNFTYSDNTMKYTLQVSNWPFKSAQNQLVINFTSPYNASLDSNPCDSVSVYDGDAGNFKYYQVNFPDFSLLIKFINIAILDERQRYIQFNLTNGLSVIIPYFFQTAQLDPDYTVLVDINRSSEECGGQDTDEWKVTVAVVVVVVTLIAAALMFFFVRSKVRTKAALQRIQRALSEQSVIKVMQHEPHTQL